jgi:transposase-like protein
MKKRAEGEIGKQGATKPTAGSAKHETMSPRIATALLQLALPMFAASEALKRGLLAFVQQMGFLAFMQMLEAEAEMIAGPKGKHAEDRSHHHWGSATTTLPFGGRHVVIDRPRVRRKGKGAQKEVELPTLEQLREVDPMPARVAEQIVAGVSTRGYARSLEPVDEIVETRGDSKSNVSRALIERTTEKLTEFLHRKLGDLDLVAMFIDGIEVAGHAVIIALGVTVEGKKEPLGVWIGSTENGVVATALLQNLMDRGLRVEHDLLFVIDGGKGIRKALKDVFGERALVQRCQTHKQRNVRDHLPESRRVYVARQMREAYKSKSANTAKKKLMQLVSWLEENGEASAAASLREGLDETLTVLRLELPALLCRTFSTSNAIENMNGTLRRVLRNVKRWRGEKMINRWVALGVAEAQRGFRRVKGHHQLEFLIRALRSKQGAVVDEKKVA